jgi:hypothetical protein
MQETGHHEKRYLALTHQITSLRVLEPMDESGKREGDLLTALEHMRRADMREKINHGSKTQSANDGAFPADAVEICH